MTFRSRLHDALERHKRALPALALELPPEVFDDYMELAVQLDYAARRVLEPDYEAGHAVLVKRGIRSPGTTDSGLAHEIIDVALGLSDEE